jgi:putative ABC transport system permease protein
MRKVTLKGLLAHKLRLALTALAIVLGVTFISGTFVLTDTLHNTFSVLFGNVYQKIDFQVRGSAQLGSGASAQRNELPQSLLATVRGVPGVTAAQGGVTGYAQFVAPDGKAIQTGGAPTLGVSFDPDPRLSNLNLIAGGPPRSAGDVVMDAGTASKYGFAVGQRVRILFAGPPGEFTISGIAQFGSANNLAGATLAAFTLPTAQQVTQEAGRLDDINVLTAPGVSKAAVQRAIARVLPPGVEVVTGQTVAQENTSAVNQALSFFSTALLVFAFISLFVGGFTILNTFSIIVGQRTRELALLRVVGASRRQVFRSVLAEAAIVGLVSSVIGLGLGVLAALGLEALMRGFGITLPSGSLVFAARTVLVGLIVGVGVTVVSAIGPARRAVRIPPVAALDDRRAAAEVSSQRRFVLGGALGLLGVLALAAGLARPAIALVGLGALCIFVGAATLAPALARPVAGVLGRPLARIFGMPGKLGRENSMRSPRRTAQTASALMVGLALVSAMAVFGASLSRSATSLADDAISANLLVTTSNGAGQLSDALPPMVAAVPGVLATTTVYRDRFEVGGTLAPLTGVATSALSDTLILRMTSGSPAALAQGELLIDSTTARSKHLSVGSAVPVRFALTGQGTMRVGGVYQANALIGSYLVGAGFFLTHFSNASLGALLVRTDGGPGVQDAVGRALAPYPNVQVQTKAQFEQTQTASVNQLLGLVYALLGLAVLIAMIGIVNTLLLSVFERTREIGLLRAVGMRRRQVRGMIRSEAVIMALFGALIGIVIGTGMGLALVSSLKQQGVTDTVVPVSSLLIFLVLSAVLGLVAAVWPARRAARLDVLAAIAAQLSRPSYRGTVRSAGIAIAVRIRPLLTSQRPSKPVRVSPFTTGPSTSSLAAKVPAAGSMSTEASSKPSQRRVSGNHAL